jgi:glycosyltransferase involved in cell wall biosynthesis
MPKPFRIIMSAYACEPNAASEPCAGWNYALQAARHGNEVHVVTRANNRARIEPELARHPVANLHFHYLDLPAVFLRAKKAAGHYGLVAYYYVWQVALAFVAARLHRKCRFDLAHHATFINDWMPSGLVVLPIPFLWGPVGGSTNQLPRQIDLRLPAYARRHERARSGVQRLLRAADPLVVATRSRAARVLVFTKEAMNGIPARQRGKAKSIIHIGVSESELRQAPVSVPPADEMRVVMGGRLVHWKGFDLALEGFAGYLRQCSTAGRLIITGEGPYQPVLKDLAARLGIESRVDFLGRLPTRTDVCALLRTCSLYSLPTLRDGPLMAVLEAMAMGLPVLCMRFGSTNEMVPDSAGLKIELNSRDQVVSDIARALAWAATHRDDLRVMGERARAHVARFYTWDRIGDEIQAVYEEMLPQPPRDERS